MVNGAASFCKSLKRGTPTHVDVISITDSELRFPLLKTKVCSTVKKLIRFPKKLKT
jgi:hypothetical protein